MRVLSQMFGLNQSFPKAARMRSWFFGIRRRESLGSFRHYLIGLCLVVLAVLIRLIITKQGSASAPFITFFPATALAALIGGLGPGVMVAACGAFLASMAFFPRPISGFILEDYVLLGFYLLTEVVICLVIDAMHSANSRYITLVEELTELESSSEPESGAPSSAPGDDKDVVAK
jgi:hypothetical protein